MTILVTTCSADHGAYCVIVPNCVFDPLEYHDTNALSSTIAACSFIKGEASPFGTQDIEPGHWNKGVGREDQTDTSSNSLELLVLDRQIYVIDNQPVKSLR